MSFRCLVTTRISTGTKEKDIHMIKLYGFGANFGVADPSPFVLKTDLYLRVAGIEFESVAHMSNLGKAPKGKLPFIEDDGELIADSFFIRRHLQNKYAVDLDQHLSAEQRASAYLLSKALDEDLYWCLVYSRWIREDTWPLSKQAFFGDLPFPLKQIISGVSRRGVRVALNKQGLGRHSDAEIQQLCRQSIDSLALLLGDQTYFFGEQISSLDITAFALLANLILSEIDNPFTRIARSHENLLHYCQRIQNQYYGEPMEATVTEAMA